MPVCWKLSYLNINSLSRIYWGVVVIGGDWCLYTRQNQDVRLLAHNDSLGRLWLPPGRHVLGSDAAALLLPHIHSSEQPHHRRLAFDVNMSGNCCVHVLLQLCVRRKMSVAFDAACYIKHVVKVPPQKKPAEHLAETVPADVQAGSDEAAQTTHEDAALSASLFDFCRMLSCY